MGWSFALRSGWNRRSALASGLLPAHDGPDRITRRPAPAALIRGVLSSAGDVKQSDHGSRGVVPGSSRGGSRLQFDRASLPPEIVCRLVRKPDRTVLPRTDDQTFGALLVHVLGFVQGDGVGSAVHPFGEVL